jgi:flagellar motor switch/type III secretory pathway protein FliN
VEKDLKIQPYPWHALETLPREAVGLLRDVRRATQRAIDAEKVGGALSELVGEHVGVLVSRIEVAAAQIEPLGGVSLTLATSDDAALVHIELDRELGRTLVARVIGRPAKLSDPAAPGAPEIEGALLAIVCSVARRAHGSREALRPLGASALRFSPGERRLDVHATVLIGPDAFPARATIQLRRPFATDSISIAEQVSSLGDLPISLPVVVASSSATSGEIYGMAEGDIWMPGDGWTIRQSQPTPQGHAQPCVGEVLFAAPSAERGIAARLGEGGEIVVVGVRSIGMDAETMMASSNQDNQTATSEVILEAPLVVRVECGAVTMTAREWAALAPGDVVALGRRMSEPVILRVAGLEVARGELVDIEGELGVRIRERVKST